MSVPPFTLLSDISTIGREAVVGGAVAEVLAVDGETDWVVEGWAGAGMAAGDPARVVGYVLSPLRGQYLAIMEVLEQSVDHLAPAEVRRRSPPRGRSCPLPW
jgi:hypothetical protein